MKNDTEERQIRIYANIFIMVLRIAARRVGWNPSHVRIQEIYTHYYNDLLDL